MSQNGLKICSQCLQDKQLNAFYRDYAIIGYNAYQAKCKECMQNNSKVRHQNQPANITSKQCITCGFTKHIHLFSISYRHKDGYFKECKKCLYDRRSNVGFNPMVKRTKDYMQDYWKKRRENVQYRVKSSVKVRLRDALKRQNCSKNGTTQTFLGCDIHFFIKWIDFCFEESMSWKNHGTIWELDHVLPCNAFDLSSNNEIIECFNWRNYQPLSCSENRKKSDKIIEHYLYKQNEKIAAFIDKFSSQINVNDNDYYTLIPLPVGESPTVALNATNAVN